MKPADHSREIYQAAVKIREPYSSLTEVEKTEANQLWERFKQLELELGTLPYSDRLRPMLLSKTGQLQAAVNATEERYQQSANWETAIAVANAARRAGDLERAVAMFIRGTEHDPKDVTCWLEVGDIRLEQRRLTESLAAYEQALAKEPNHAWALPSAFYCRWQLGVAGDWAKSLHELAHQQACTCGMEGCLTAVFGGYGASQGIARANYLLKKAHNSQ